MAANLFVYGSLERAEVLHALTGAHFTARAAVLEGHRRGRISGEVYPGIVEEAGAHTRGVLYRDLDAVSLTLLDAFEGDLYERRRLQVRLSTGGRVAAHVYVVPRAHAHRVSRAHWQPRRFEREHLAGFLELCRAFVAGRSGGPP